MLIAQLHFQLQLLNAPINTSVTLNINRDSNFNIFLNKANIVFNMGCKRDLKACMDRFTGLIQRKCVIFCIFEEWQLYYHVWVIWLALFLDWFGFLWFVWCGQGPSSTSYDNQPTTTNVESGKPPVFETVEMNVQGWRDTLEPDNGMTEYNGGKGWWDTFEYHSEPDVTKNWQNNYFWNVSGSLKIKS